MKPQPGQVAPDFTASVVGDGYDEAGKLTLSDLKGSRVVLYFYPRDLTPGCTIQACALRDDWAGIPKDVKLFGVSPDDAKSHRKFIDKKSLPFPLISDEDNAIAESYGVWVQKSLFGKKYMGTERSTFVIGADGMIEAVLEKVSPGKHFKLLTEALA